MFPLLGGRISLQKPEELNKGVSIAMGRERGKGEISEKSLRGFLLESCVWKGGGGVVTIKPCLPPYRGRPGGIVVNAHISKTTAKERSGP